MKNLKTYENNTDDVTNLGKIVDNISENILEYKNIYFIKYSIEALTRYSGDLAAGYYLFVPTSQNSLMTIKKSDDFWKSKNVAFLGSGIEDAKKLIDSYDIEHAANKFNL
jgi:hypothetical protein